ncbi:PAS domain-containing protein [Breznakibacter xylanolyticus]|uniref:PAS domain-containing protein n=1 Tax=Breznakibacter xylanolyticus TaxID=990 RepID=A0A2W7NFS0_9BACT|nr:LuxR C-terminal-related transcriptional regulator [Breznakibacter xylanolyticus]PZX10142.1 PAS domain-containing protein [Breznakibacter xylanolyticus]
MPHSTSDLQAIIAERDFYKKILDALPAVVHVNNLETQMVDWINGGVVQISGYEPGQIVNNPDFLKSVVVPDDLTWMAESIVKFKVMQQRSDSYLYSMRHADGTVATYQGFGVVFERDAAGRPLRNLAIDIDITHEISNYKQLKRHLEEMTKQLHQSQLKQLTKTEKQVIVYLCDGKTVKEIAGLLHRSVHTIANHKRNVYSKLGLHRTGQLVGWAKEVGLW